MEKYRPNILEPPKQKPTRLNEFQAYQRVFERMLYGEEMPDVGKRFLRLLAEVHELKEFESIPNLKEELETNEPLRQAIAGEIVDVLILGISVLDHLGFDAENKILEKIGLNFSKYNAKRLAYWLSKGLSREEAIKKLKEEWNEAFLKDEYGNTVFK
jgi:hypothetical protein